MFIITSILLTSTRYPKFERDPKKHLLLFRIASWRDNRWIQITYYLTSWILIDVKITLTSKINRKWKQPISDKWLCTLYAFGDGRTSLLVAASYSIWMQEVARYISSGNEVGTRRTLYHHHYFKVYRQD